MSMKPMPLDEFFKMMAGANDEAAKKSAQAHDHAREYARALRDEVEAARRAGACDACIANETLKFAARLSIESLVANGLKPEQVAANLPKVSEDFAVVFFGEWIEHRAEQIAKGGL